MIIFCGKTSEWSKKLMFLWLSIGLCDLNARAQAPANDNLANAQGIIGSSGVAYAPNVNATAEANEPAPYVNPAQATVWFEWTAPITTTVDFSTRGSTDDTPEGNVLGTVMAIYSISPGAALAFSNLTLVASNAYDPSSGVTNGPMTSRLDFPVTVGQTYLIQVDGSTNTPSGAVDEGTVELNWSPSLMAGTFMFSSYLNLNGENSYYFASEFEDYLTPYHVPESIDPSLHNPYGSNNVRITVSRYGGYTGRCEVTLLVTNGTYYNTLITNYYVTNTYITNFDTNLNVLSYTNEFFTNIVSENAVQDLVRQPGGSGGFMSVPVYALYTAALTNNNGTATPLVISNIPLSSLPIQTNFWQNFSRVNGTTTTVTTNTSTITSTTVQLLTIEDVTNSMAISAQSGVDYVPFGPTNLVFNDFQMSQDVYLNINPSNVNLSGPDWPDASSNYLYNGINPYVVLTLTNAVLDPQEDPDIVPPSLYPFGSTASLAILTCRGNPFNATEKGPYLTTNTSQSVTINLERATFRVNKANLTGTNPPPWTNTAYLYLLLTGQPDANDTYTVNYTIDWPSAALIGNIGNPFWNNFFPAVADSDYAQHNHNGGVTNQDFSDPLNNPPSEWDLTGVGGSFTTWSGSSGTVTIGPFNGGNYHGGEIAVPIYNWGATEFDLDMAVHLFFSGSADPNLNAKVPAFIGNVNQANLTINFGGPQPGGAYDTNFNPPNQPVTSYPAFDPTPGANPPGDPGAVKAIAIQPNGQAIIGGYFKSYDTMNVHGIARLLTNGWLDKTFNNVSYGGVDDHIDAILVDANSNIIIGGYFSSYDNLGNTPACIARLTPNGALDGSFHVGSGFNGEVFALALDANGNILAGGDFTAFNSTNCNHLVRLLPNGALDPSFVPNTGNGQAGFGTDQDVLAVAPDSNGDILLGGNFNYVNGQNLNYLARLLPDGTVDPSFNPNSGPDGFVDSLAVETNNEVIIGGDFETYNGVSTPRLALINTIGMLDTSFSVGSGADDVVCSVVLQTNGDVLAGGQFKNFNSSRRMGVVRLLPNGWVDTSFMDTSYNQFAGLVSSYSDSSVDPTAVYALALQPDGNVLIGGAFSQVGGGQTRDAINTQINLTRLIGAPTPGPMTDRGGTNNCPGNITLTQNPYSVYDTAGKLYLTLDRLNGSLGPAQVTIGTNTLNAGSGAATASDFGLILPEATPVFNTPYYNGWSVGPPGSYGWRVSDGYWSFNILPATGSTNSLLPPLGGAADFGESACSLNIFDNPAATENLTASLSLLDITELNMLFSSPGNGIEGPLDLGGVIIPTFPALGLSGAPLQIIDNNANAMVGYIGFSSTNYVVVNTNAYVTLTVIRTNGNQGQISADYFTANGSALSGVNFTGVSLNDKKTVTFNATDAYTFNIPILNPSELQSSKSFKVYLTNASQPAALNCGVLPIVTTVSIIDGDFSPGHLCFTAPAYSAMKGGPATISVERINGGVGQLTVQCATSDGTAVNGRNYSGATNTLVWNGGTGGIQTFTVPTLQDNSVDGNLTVNLTLLNASNTAYPNENNLILFPPTNAMLTILESDSYGSFNFAAPNYTAMQTAGQALITVTRTSGVSGTATVYYATADDTNAPPGYGTAQAGVNYGATNGTLTFLPGVTAQSFVVPVYDTPAETTISNRVVTLMLTGGSSNISAQFPKYATLTILDPQLIFNPAGSVVNGVNGGFNGPVNSLALQPDGNILVGGDFTFFGKYPSAGVARLYGDGVYDNTFLSNQVGVNGGGVFQVLSSLTNMSQSNDGAIVVAGSFTNVDYVNRDGVARLNLDGSIDAGFDPGMGANGTIYGMAEVLLPTGSNNQMQVAYYIGGSFSSFDGTPSGGIARLIGVPPDRQGEVDSTFSFGQGVTGLDATVRALAVQADNSLIVGGDFTNFNGLTYNHLVRLNSAGVVDPTFNAGTGGSVRAIAIQPDGRILVGGIFTNVMVSNVNYNLNYLARLNADGSVDTNFHVGLGGNSAVLAVAVDDQQRVLVGGEFSSFSGVTRSGITRLNPDGTVDPTINFGSGANGGYVDTIVVQNDDEIDIGGSFNGFGGASVTNFARLYGGAIATPGTIQFTQPIYGVLQNGTNAAITLERTGCQGTVNQLVSVLFSTCDGSAQAGTDYIAVATNVIFPLGESYETVLVPIINNKTAGSNKTVNLSLSGATGVNPGGQQTTATLVITNVNSAVEFSAMAYRDAANANFASIPVQRIGDPNTKVSVFVYTGNSGTATPFVNYVPNSAILTFNPGVTTLDFTVMLSNSPSMFSDRTVDLEMTSPSNTTLGQPASAMLTIANVYTNPGVISFAQPYYGVSEGATNAPITLVRTNGSSGVVSVTLTTCDGTATNGVNYMGTNAIVNFVDGQTSQTMHISVMQQATWGPDRTVYLALSNPQGSEGAPLISGPNPVILTISNDIALAEDVALGASVKPSFGLKGKPITYSETVTNLGPSAIGAISVTNTLSTNLSMSSLNVLQAPGAYSSSGNQIVFQIGSLKVGQSANLCYTVVPSSIGFVTNWATVSSTVADPNMLNNSSQIVSAIIVPPCLTVSPSASSAFFTWNTPFNSVVQVAYGLTPADGNITALSTPSTCHVLLLSGLQRDATYYFNASAWWADGSYATPYSTNGTFATTDTIILNTSDAALSGIWIKGPTSAPGYYGPYFNETDETNTGATASATYNPCIPTPGLYNVDVWYPSGPTFSTNVPIVVNGTTNGIFAEVNQSTNGGCWRPLATNLFFAQGMSGNAVIYNNTGNIGRLVAQNAMMWSYVTNQDYSSIYGGIPSWWSSFYSNTSSANTNYADYVFGLSPNDATSTLDFWVSVSSSNVANVYFAPYQGGRTYRLQTTANLFNPRWTTLTNEPCPMLNCFTNAIGAFTNGAGYGVFTINQPNAGQLFYRLAAQLCTNF